MINDLRSALRGLRKSPGFTAIAVLSLAVGIGANTAIFSLLDAVLLRTLPVKDPQELVELVAVYPKGRQTNLPSEVYEHVRKASGSFSAVFASYSGGGVALRADGHTERVQSLFVSGNYFPALGVGSALGRLLSDEDDRPGAPRVAVLSHGLWSRRFGQRAGIVGESVLVEGAPTTIVGVSAPAFVGVDRSARPEIILPLSSDRQVSSLWIVGRLRPGVTIAQARGEIEPLYTLGVEAAGEQTRLWSERDRKRFFSQRVELLPAARGTASLRWQLALPLEVLGIVVVLVLLIACTNVAALLLARGESRRGETVVRFALGASRGRIVQGFLVESSLLSVLGGLGGIALAFASHRLLLGLLPLDASAGLEFRLDLPVLGFTLVVAMIASVLTGLVPALRGTRLDPFAVLRGAMGRVDRGQRASSRAILVVQSAGVLVLLVGAGLFLRTLQRLLEVETGFDKQHVLVAQIEPSQSRYSGPRSILAQDELVERVRRLPGVTAAAVGGNAIFGREPWIVQPWVDGYHSPGDDRERVAFNEVGPGFFGAVGLPVVTGREFTPRDDRSAGRVAVINSAFARKYLGNGNPLGRRLGPNPSSPREWEVVGVAADSKFWSLREAAEPAVFLPLAQGSRKGRFWIHVRSARDASALIPLVRSDIALLDPGLEVSRIMTVEDRVNGTLASERLFATLTTLFALVALALAGVGLFGSAAQAVARRTSEIGIRAALGADRPRIVRLILSETLLVSCLGIAVGVPIALVGAQSLGKLLYGVAPSDPSTLVSAVVTLVAASVVAGIVPARRAASIDPMVALRCE